MVDGRSAALTSTRAAHRSWSSSGKVNRTYPWSLGRSREDFHPAGVLSNESAIGGRLIGDLQDVQFPGGGIDNNCWGVAYLRDWIERSVELARWRT